MDPRVVLQLEGEVGFRLVRGPQWGMETRCVDGWVPVQSLRRTRATFWSHYLALEEQSDQVKCRHCGCVLKKPQRGDARNKLFRMHLERVHSVAAETVYTPPSSAATSTSSIKSRLRVASTTQHAEVYKRGKSTATTPTQEQVLPLEDDPSTSQLLAVIVASENLPITFVSDPAMQALLGRISPLYQPQQQDILDLVWATAEQISQLVCRTARRNSADLQLVLSTIPPVQAGEISAYLYNLEDVTFFALTSHEWYTRDHSTSLVTLQFWDSIDHRVKTLPVSLHRSPGVAPLSTETLREQLRRTEKDIPGIIRSTLGVTCPQPKLLFNRDNVFEETSTGTPEFHPCVITMLAECARALLGTDGGDPTDESSTKTSDQSDLLLNSMVDLSGLDMAGSLFNIINTMYDELLENPWILDLFHSKCKEQLGYTEPQKPTCFDRTKYSTAETCLENFLHLKPVLFQIDPLLHSVTRQPLQEADFETAECLLDLILSMNRLIRYFSDSRSTFSFAHTVPALMSLEMQICKMAESRPTPRKLDCSLNRFSSTLHRCKRVLMQDKTVLVGLFLYPPSLFEREVLEYVYKTTSLSEIVTIVEQTILKLIRRFVDLQLVNTAGDDTASCEADIERGVNEQIMKITQADLYDYLSTINTIIPASYKRYSEQSGYVRDKGEFKRQPPHGSRELPGEIGQVDQLLDVYVPVSNAFWEHYLEFDAGPILRLLVKMMRTYAVSSALAPYAYLSDFVPELGDQFLEPMVKIKLFNEQYVVGKVDFEMDTLSTAAQYH
ncbi:uncharacterized protein KNAG_0B05930 [Huiozyma naganishii CBS 8797]|uniref:BED-type domain-containing protein n=1 Tax=Huiozyma naganishii (strain ATCC MYA-139 / BCRC 22969 / CBS 8797 / KCTC 17520 / NBRC 10181 / NCYC 3082 / Yp74L-3) TaxID=1071383 RepID=J7RHK6_HUIN7|nr:hypothetical protein KNAG_0B05930 [Kazachstania naganishii CBS 8797]CCK69023.1 hypothetical protein KNAG_0B05930 [Kazachstania naganishii CBS 8797]